MTERGIQLSGLLGRLTDAFEVPSNALSDSMLNALIWLGHATWQSSLLIVIVLLLKALLGSRISPTVHYFLWVPVLARLTLPFLFDGSLSVYSIISYVPGIGVLNRFDSGNGGLSGDCVFLLMIVWLSGVIVGLRRLVFLHWKFNGVVRQGEEVLDARIQKLLEHCKGSLSIRTSVRLIESSRLATPAISGLIRPVLILPKGLLVRISSRELQHIFLHELAHYKNGDLWVCWLARLINILHWFNPITRYGISCLFKDCENACDARVLDVLERGEERKAYGYTLLKLFAELPERDVAASGALFMFEGKRSIRQRIDRIVRFKSSPWHKREFALLSVFPLAIAAMSQPASYCGFGSENNKCETYCETEKPPPTVGSKACAKPNIKGL